MRSIVFLKFGDTRVTEMSAIKAGNFISVLKEHFFRTDCTLKYSYFASSIQFSLFSHPRQNTGGGDKNTM